ncbi:MAG: carbohydrate kinase [Gammaproteobacteria bacterium]|nr:carbohydrate kinase [Gammaproteobacteria bacterium]
MSATSLILTVDFGTQSVRAILFDLQGRQQGSASVPVPQAQSPQNGWAEQDAEQLWRLLCAACRQVISTTDQPDRIKGIAITTMRATVVPVNSDGCALRPAITWPDQRHTQGVPPVGGVNGLLLALAGARKTVRYFQSQAETNWLAVHEPSLWQKTHRFLLLSGYFNFRMTGLFRDSWASQIAFVPFDFKRRCWAKSSSWKWQALPWIKREQLPELVKPGDRIGTVTASAAAASGIPEGIPVIAAASDKACEVLGAGASEQHFACLSFGTAATVNVSSARYKETAAMIPPYPAARPDRWNLEVQVSQGFWLVNWFKKEFGQAEVSLADSQNVSAESLLDQLLGQSSPGAGGLLAQPYWTPGLRTPGPEARGAIIGLSPASKRADIYRALLEGILFALRQGKERIEHRLGQKIQALLVTGGGACSDAVVQLTADLFGSEITRANEIESSALGAAINVAVGTGDYDTYEHATAAMTRPGKLFRPDVSASTRYQALYRDSYLPLYARLKPVYHSLQRQDHPAGQIKA